jgi:hypothetical protein
MRTLTSSYSGGECRNPSFGLVTKAKGLQGCGPKGSLGIKAKKKLASQGPEEACESRPRASPRVKAKRKPGSQGQEKARELRPRGNPGIKAKRSQGCGPRKSPRVTSHTPKSVRKCEGVNPHTPKATPTLGDGVPMDSWNFKGWFHESKPNCLWCFLYHWKDLET